MIWKKLSDSDLQKSTHLLSMNWRLNAVHARHVHICETIILLVLHADDLLLASNDRSTFENIKNDLMDRLKRKDLGPQLSLNEKNIKRQN